MTDNEIINRQRAEIERLKGWQDLLKAEKHSLIKSEAIKETEEKVADEVRRVHVEIPFPEDGITTKEEMEEWGNIVVELLSTAVNNALKEIKEMVGENK